MDETIQRDIRPNESMLSSQRNEEVEEDDQSLSTYLREQNSLFACIPKFPHAESASESVASMGGPWGA